MKYTRSPNRWRCKQTTTHFFRRDELLSLYTFGCLHPNPSLSSPSSSSPYVRFALYRLNDNCFAVCESTWKTFTIKCTHDMAIGTLFIVIINLKWRVEARDCLKRKLLLFQMKHNILQFAHIFCKHREIDLTLTAVWFNQPNASSRQFN